MTITELMEAIDEYNEAREYRYAMIIQHDDSHASHVCECKDAEERVEQAEETLDERLKAYIREALKDE